MNKFTNVIITPVFILLSFISIISSCRHKPVIPASPSISYANEIQPIILGSCALSGCHDSHSRRKALTNYSEVMSYVSAGNALNSKLYKTIVSIGPGSGQMPIDQPLSEDQIKLIYVWIMQGAKNN
jgi:hypothetical protein